MANYTLSVVITTTDISIGNSMVKLSILAVFAAAALATAVAQSTPAQSNSSAASAGPTLPPGPGKAILQRACTACHGVDMIVSQRNNVDGWSQTVDEMMSRGADLSDDDADVVVHYLATNFGLQPKPAGSSNAAAPPSDAANSSAASSASTAPVNVNKASAQDLQSALGLSQAEAQAIVQYRSDHGDFKTWQDVAAVPGAPHDKIQANSKRLTF
ncbi:MAG TPA: helix-hairpin-helix domain-containing protein [Acidobacteriaceae bacterium]|nr:helix-hairpin-helix domain-containing protein [Acidobacteriaceae bacterium]